MGAALTGKISVIEYKRKVLVEKAVWARICPIKGYTQFIFIYGAEFHLEDRYFNQEYGPNKYLCKSMYTMPKNDRRKAREGKLDRYELKPGIKYDFTYAYNKRSKR